MIDTAQLERERIAEEVRVKAELDKQLNLYRVAYVFRQFPGSNPIEKVAFVVANTELQASTYVRSLSPYVEKKEVNKATGTMEYFASGNEVMSISTEKKNVFVASTVVASTPKPASPVPPQVPAAVQVPAQAWKTNTYTGQERRVTKGVSPTGKERRGV